MSGEKTEKPTEQRKKKARAEGQVARTPDLGAWAGMLAASFLVPMALLSVGLLVIGVAAAAAQGGIRIAPKLFIPKFSRLNPLPGIKRAFGGHALWEATKVTVKTAVLGGVLYMAVRDLVPALISYGVMPLTALLDLIGQTAVNLMRYAALAGLAMAGADYAMARRRTNKQTY